VQLFVRGPRNVSLTPVGSQFLVEARKVLEQVQRAALVAARSDVAVAFRTDGNAPSTQRLLDLCAELGGAIDH
jgi:DNA-binding transcriptional LysR family regulator